MMEFARSTLMKVLEEALGVSVSSSFERGQLLVVRMSDYKKLPDGFRRTIKIEGIKGYVKADGLLYIRSYRGQEVTIPF